MFDDMFFVSECFNVAAHRLFDTCQSLQIDVLVFGATYASSAVKQRFVLRAMLSRQITCFLFLFKSMYGVSSRLYDLVGISKGNRVADKFRSVTIEVFKIVIRAILTIDTVFSVK